MDEKYISFQRRWHLQFSLPLLLIFMTSRVLEGHAALLVLPSGEQHHIVWERVLVVYDSLSMQQTVIGESAVSGSPSQFAILIATPKVAMINYTTTRIWRKLGRYIKQKEFKTRTLSFSIYSWLWKMLKSPNQVVQNVTDKVDVLKSKDTQVHIRESALHEWLITRGLSLTPEQALSIKKVYNSGLAVTVLHVKPRAQKRQVPIHETWTSTWIFSHEVDEPHYLSLFQTPLGFREEVSQTSDNQLKLYFISDQTLAYSINSENKEETYTEDACMQGVAEVLSRVEINELNYALNAQNWSFNRRGILSAFELTAPLSIQRIRGRRVDRSKIQPRPTKIVPQVYLLAIPVELGLILLYFGLLFIRKRL
jgi:hypothetical protein